MSKKIRVYHFHNGIGGGVFSVIKNLLKFSKNPDIENHVIYTINREKTNDFSIPSMEGASSQQVFYYSPKWNFYYTCKQLAKLLPDDKAVLIAHDWLELGMVSNLGLQNPVVQYVHGDYDYYYQLARLHSPSVDKFIAVAENIKTKLIRLTPEREKDIYYLRFPVFDGYKRIDGSQRCNIIFIGRLTEGKGYHLLPAIANELRKKNIKSDWHIVGEDCDGLKEKIVWNEEIKVKHYGTYGNDEVRKLLTEMDFIILPSAFEGMPVILVEAMKTGVIPLVNDIDGGMQELIIDNETGFKIRENNIHAYTERIIDLLENKRTAESIRNNCIEKANMLFDANENTKNIEDVIIEVAGLKKVKKPIKVYGSRLDHQWLGNTVTYMIRKKFKRSRHA